MPSSGSGKAALKNCSFPCFLTPQLSTSSFVDQTQRSNDNSTTFRYEFATAATSSLYPHTQFTNHESLPRLPESFRSFLRAFPQYLQTIEADQIRATDYQHLSISNHICLDYAGYGLFSYAQVRGPDPAVATAAAGPVASSSSSDPPQPPSNFSRVTSFELSYISTDLNFRAIDTVQALDFESQVRTRIMKFLNISSEDYSLVFTANQSTAFKVLAESYPFQTNRSLLTVYDHENEAVETMIQSSKKRGARPVSADFKWPSFKIHCAKLKEIIVSSSRSKRKKSKSGLFVFPLQSRLTGARYSHQWMSLAKENNWHVLLDATALGPKDMDSLGLSLFRPDFLFCTCYKVFGHNPSGFGCLFVKNSNSLTFDDSTTTLGRGIVNLVPPSHCYRNVSSTTNTCGNQTLAPELCNDDRDSSTSLSREFHQTGGGGGDGDGGGGDGDGGGGASSSLANTGEVHQADGGHSEPSSIPHVQFKGLDHADTLGLVRISSRSRYLINWLINAMSSLKHPNSELGHPVINIYGPRVRLERAPILAFNVFDWKGGRVDPHLVQKLAGRNNISLGCGFMKRIWFGERYGDDKERLLEQRTREAPSKKSENVDYGILVLTVTVGYLNNFEDVYGLWAFVARFLDADFVEKERWRYTALNQRTVEV